MLRHIADRQPAINISMSTCSSGSYPAVIAPCGFDRSRRHARRERVSPTSSVTGGWNNTFSQWAARKSCRISGSRRLLPIALKNLQGFSTL